MIQNNKTALDFQLSQAVLRTTNAKPGIDAHKVHTVGNMLYACYCQLIGQDIINRKELSHQQQMEDFMCEGDHSMMYLYEHVKNAQFAEYQQVITDMVGAMRWFFARPKTTDLLQELVSAMERALIAGHVYLNRTQDNNMGCLNDVSSFYWSKASN